VLHHSLAALDKSCGDSVAPGDRKGNSLAQLRALIEETGADAVFWNDRYEPAASDAT